MVDGFIALVRRAVSEDINIKFFHFHLHPFPEGYKIDKQKKT